MRKRVNWRLIFAALIAAIVVLGLLLFRTESMAGADCVSSLINPNAGNRQVTLFYTSYGFPLTFMTIYTSGCFESRTTQVVDWSAAGLLVNVSLAVAIGASAYWLLARRHRKAAATGGG